MHVYYNDKKIENILKIDVYVMCSFLRGFKSFNGLLMMDADCNNIPRKIYFLLDHDFI